MRCERPFMTEPGRSFRIRDLLSRLPYRPFVIDSKGQAAFSGADIHDDPGQSRTSRTCNRIFVNT
ncbi:unnamed protein product [Mycetohabitans rhizoxinica HKI 454]|uniref:Uncharacterized protein n=1 Tax=Mycetohabitans rhizoxinica (strain DSM 19002 / CIP 109453 / HKI 454) TaxID=882378 RepID=E5AR35_MYCRK|nr:unnamed protein product [Mycetohabitans rhizoxinica HKI 454]